MDAHDEPLEADDPSQDRPHTAGERSVIESESRLGIVCGVHHDVDVLEEPFDRGRVEAHGLRLQFQVGIARGEALTRYIHLEATHVASSKEHLSLKVGQLHMIVVHEANRPHARLSEAHEDWAAKATSADDERARLKSIQHDYVSYRMLTM